MKKPTKEELIIKVAKLEQDKEVCKLNSEQVRKEFAKAFAWFKSESFGYGSPEPLLPTWGEIWVHIGSLLVDKDIVDLTKKQKLLTADIENLRERIMRMEEKRGVIK